MAALYLHNAIHIPDLDSTESAHSRHLSALSTPSLRTSTSDSHPTEPLIYFAQSESSAAYQELLNSQPDHPARIHASWNMSLNLDGDQTTPGERKSRWEKSLRRRLKVLRVSKSLLEIVMGVWATYNAVRYFLAYTLYTSSIGESVALALGTGSAVSIAFLLAATFLSLSSPYLSLHNIPIRTLLLVRTVLYYLSSFLLLGPAIVSLALVFAWKHSIDPQVNIEERCYLDVDVVWPVSKARCTFHPEWGVWLALSAARVAVTLLIIIIYHVTCITYDHARRSSHRSTGLRHSESTTRTLPTSPPMTDISPSTPRFLATLPKLPSHEPSQTTIGSHRGRSLRSSLFHQHSYNSGRLSRSSDSSSEDLQDITNLQMFNATPTANPNAIQSVDADLNNFVDRFRSLVSQITRETEEAMEFSTTSRPDSAMGSYPNMSQATSGLPTVQDFRHQPIYDLGDEFDFYDRSETPDDTVRVLGSYIRRMSTIESMGSREREMAGSRGSSVQTDLRERTLHTPGPSRPPTRANTSGTGTSSSEPPSRANSRATSYSMSFGSGGERLSPDVGGQPVGRSGSSSTRGTESTRDSGSAASYYTAPGPRTASPADWITAGN